MSATITKAELERVAPRVQRCVDCRAEIAVGFRCETCAAEPDLRNGHTGICVDCRCDIPVNSYRCAVCAVTHRAFGARGRSEARRIVVKEPILPDVYEVAPKLAELLGRHLQWRVGMWTPPDGKAFLDETRRALGLYEDWARRGER